MELEKQIYEEIIKKLDLEEETVQNLEYDTILFDMGDDRENLGLDSLDALELVTLIYEKWDIDIPQEDMKKLYSVNAIAEYIRKHEKD